MIRSVWFGGMVACTAKAEVSFAEPVDLSGGVVDGVTVLEVGDINDDGRADVLTIEGGMHGNRASFVWFESPTSGSEWIPHTVNHSASLKRFVGSGGIADFNGDGFGDIVVTTDFHSGDVRLADLMLFINPGLDAHPDAFWSHFFLGQDLPIHHINDLVIADIDTDGRLDVVVRTLEPNLVLVCFQRGLNDWVKREIPTDLIKSEGLAVGDVNGDGRPDISFTGYILITPPNPRVDPFQKIVVDAAYATVNQNTKEALVDLDGDGWRDLVLAPAESFRHGRPHDLVWYRNPSGGRSDEWARHVIDSPVNDFHTLQVALIDGDDRPDILVAAPWKTPSIRIYTNLGSGAFSSPQFISREMGLYTGRVFDFDQDGALDIVGQETYAKGSRPRLIRSLREVNAEVEVEGQQVEDGRKTEN